ncbi:MAG: lysyl oxidase family protein [Angustibacter sp.]
MTFSLTRRRFTWRGRTLAVVPAAAMVAAGVSMVAVDPAGGNAPGLSLRLVAAAPTATAMRYPGGMDADLGLYLSVGASSPFEVRVRRASYRDPLTAELVTGTGRYLLTSPLPRTVTADFNGLQKFFKVTVTDRAGAVLAEDLASFCPAGGQGTYGQSVRTRSDAPETNPYPAYCAGSPFGFGMVMGTQQGWAARVDGQSVFLPNLKPGDYTVRVEVAAPWRSALGIPARDGVASVALEVVKATDPGPLAAQRRGRSGPPVPQSLARALEAGHIDGLDPTRTGPFAAGRVRSAPGVSDPGFVGGTTTAGGPTVTETHPHRRPTAPGGRQGPEPSVPAAVKPDLRSLPAFGMEVLDAGGDLGGQPGHQYLAFGATVWNAGPGPLVVDGFRKPGAGLMNAFQVFYDDQNRRVASADRGTLEYDPRPGHTHWHFTDFATYQLLGADGKKIVRSEKESFCLVPTDSVDLTRPGAQWQPESTGLDTACGGPNALGLREVLPAGWGDTYGQYLPGQSFDITDLPNGVYYVQVLANPVQNLIETDTTNNESRRKIILGGTTGARTVTVPPYQGLDIP